MTTSTATRRTDSLRLLEQEVGVMIRRIRRVLWERARGVHPDLQPSGYLMLAYLADHGATRGSGVAEALAIDKGAVSRQLHHLVELGLADRTPDPDDGRATLVSASADAVERITSVTEERRRWLDERLGDWTDAELSDFATVLGRYNAALDERA
ncbi:MarR family winged helix-turn-helix transcriptional regulator [Nocardioides sp. MAHUQ-72]|uniref:MarR family winged helix-turn-helix transcriptional regulator n=1 Tax=unclassified Nocardioides TaxID=2615069 RepID=UPI0036100670